MSFDQLGLGPETLRAIADVGYETPTPIQEGAIPYVLMGRDLLGIAQTGTGKTASFTLPMIEILAQGRARARMPRSLIIAPTRELAAQVADNFTLYGKYHKLNMALLIGGSSFTDQQKELERGVDVLIATPGRLLDLFERGRILLTDVKILVIDEADRMLDMGFIPDVERIVGLLPKIRQTLFFSATMQPEIKRLADAFLMNPKEIRVARQATTAATVVQRLVPVRSRDKVSAVVDLLKHEDVKNAFIFCNRKRDVTTLFKALEKEGFSAVQLHGDMVQSFRMECLAKFKAGEVKLMVCSDVAARGIDVQAVSHVFNYDVPTHPEDYVHRIGRTGRAGMEGHAYTMATPEEDKFVRAIERLIGNPIPILNALAETAPADRPAPDAEAPAPAAETGEKAAGRRGRRRGRDRHTVDEAATPEVTTTEAAPRQDAPSSEPPAPVAPPAPSESPAPPAPSESPAPRRARGANPPASSGRGENTSGRRSGRYRSPADEVEAMDHPENMIGFGANVPAFLLPPKPAAKAPAAQPTPAPAPRKRAPRKKVEAAAAPAAESPSDE